MQKKLDDRTIRALKPKESRYDISDRDNPGLQLRVSPSGTKAFALIMRGQDGKLRRVTLGRYDANAPLPSDPSDADTYGDRLSLQSARRKAALIRARVTAGADPVAEKRNRRSDARQAANNVLPLTQLLDEYAAGPGQARRIWQSAEAPKRIRAVFQPLLQKDVRTITPDDFANAMADYRPQMRGRTGSGQISRARAYLSPVLNWAAGRGTFSKIGAHRRPRVEVSSLAETHDPASTDDTIKGQRDRVLSEAELAKLLPAFKQTTERRKGVPRGETVAADGLRTLHGPAMRFILLTAARLGEVTAMRWEHLDFERREWFKPSVKSTRGGPRSQTLPLSDAAINLLKDLPTYPNHSPTGLVFASDAAGRLQNWGRAGNRLSKITGVTDWNRHDLRRTAATIMEAIGVAPRVIEQILAHADPLKSEGVGGTAGVYIKLGKRFGGAEDPQREALDRLARALEIIESGTTGDVVELRWGA